MTTDAQQVTVAAAKFWTNLTVIVLGFLALSVAPVLLWQRLFFPADLAIGAAMYTSTAFGVTVGYHRLFAHRSFDTSPALRYLFAALGSMAAQGPLLEWVSDHRRHHACSDAAGDPHSPHVGHGDGWRGQLKGLWHAHLGWLLRTQGGAPPDRYARDLQRDPGLRFIDGAAGPLVLLGLVAPFLLGLALAGTLAGGATALFWGGLVRIFAMHHVTFSVNSICHFFGARRFATGDQSGNVAWLALPTLGESWHHNHHAFPRSAAHGLARWEIDPSGMLIRLLARLGLVWNVIGVPPERLTPSDRG